MADVKYFYGLGRRKSATARARLVPGKGTITINGKTAAEYLSDNKTMLAEITDPLALVNKQKDFDVSVLVSGGGLAGQVPLASVIFARHLRKLIFFHAILAKRNARSTAFAVLVSANNTQSVNFAHPYNYPSISGGFLFASRRLLQ
jgi:ribosomal protein S9